MTQSDAEAQKGKSEPRLDHANHPRKQSEGSVDISAKESGAFQVLESLPEGEKELISELIQALRTIRYGSIVLTVHEGQVVEINKSIRIRKKHGTKNK